MNDDWVQDTTDVLHCSMPPQVRQHIENLRDEIAQLRAQVQQVEVPHSSAAVLGYVRLERWEGGWDFASFESLSDSLDDMELELAGELDDGDPDRQIVAAVVHVGPDGRIGS
jgi:hypothetical protein